MKLPDVHIDTSSMWAELALSEAELGNVKTGATVIITMDGLGGREYRGTIAHIAPVIDPQTRTAKARVRLANPNGLLRANMYGQVEGPMDYFIQHYSLLIRTSRNPKILSHATTRRCNVSLLP